MKKVKRFHILDERYTEKGKLIDISVAFVFEDGSKEIVVMTNEAVKQMLGQKLDL